MKNIIIYPANIEIVPLLRNNLFKNCKITCVAPSGWGGIGKDIGDMDLAGKTGHIIKSDFDHELKGADSVCFIKTEQEIDKYEYIIPKIKSAIENGKDVICTIDMSQDEYIELKEESTKNGCEFSYYCNSLVDFEEIKNFLKYEQRLTEIKTPVVMVAEVVNNMGAFHAQLALQEHFREQGYNAALISSVSYSNYFKIHNSPAFLSSNVFSEEEKILLFNHYVKNIENSYSPDIIIIGVPGSLLPLTKTKTDGFGITAYLMTRAVKPDASIVCTYSDQYTQKYFDEINPTLNFRFSMNIEGYLVNNTILDFFSVEGTEDPRRIMIEPDMVKQRIPNEAKGFVFPMKEKEILFEKVIDKLAYFGEVQEL